MKLLFSVLLSCSISGTDPGPHREGEGLERGRAGHHPGVQERVADEGKYPAGEEGGDGPDPLRQPERTPKTRPETPESAEVG